MKEHARHIRHFAADGGATVHVIPSADQCRCSCGAMLARIVTGGLELKCRKCKSVVLITHEELAVMYRAVEMVPPVGLPVLLDR